MNANQVLVVGVASAMLVLGSVSQRAEAAFIVAAGNDAGGTANVISNACTGTVTGPAASVQGCLNASKQTFVNFQSSTDLLNITGGQATLSASDGIINQLTISAYDSVTTNSLTFAKLILDIQWDITPGSPAGASATVSFTANPNSGAGPFAFNLGNGSNFFTISGEDFNSVSAAISGNGRVIGVDLKQVRIGGVEGVQIPEPGTLGVLGAGLFAIGFAHAAAAAEAKGLPAGT